MLKLQPKQISQPSDGFTIIECLLAIILVGILMTAIAPAIALSVATRVQARRVELATQAARTYLSSVRSNPDETEISKKVFLDKFKKNSPDKYLFNGAVSAPASSTDITSAAALTAASLNCVDLDDSGGCTANSSKDFVIQAFRSTTIDPGVNSAPNANEINADKAKGYVLGIRVYRADAFDGSGDLKAKSSGGRVSATYAGGSGNRKSPLVEMVTEIPPTGANSWQDFCDRLGGC